MFKQATVRAQSKKKTVMRIEFMRVAQVASCGLITQLTEMYVVSTLNT